MSLTALSLAALPAATGLAHRAVQAGEQVGSGFLDVLSQIAAPLTGANDQSSTATDDCAASNGASDAPGSNSGVSEETQTWSQKLLIWLSQRQPARDFELKLSLDALDQPQIEVSGEQADSIRSALTEDPTLLQEFRELALDRVAAQGNPPPGAPQPQPPTLKITQTNGQTKTSWT